MKKIMLILLGLVVLPAMILAQEPEGKEADNSGGSGVRFSIGFRSYFSWWDPVWSQVKSGTTYLAVSTIGQNLDMTNKADFLYNPILSLRFNDRWSLSGSYSFGRYEFNTKAYAMTNTPEILLVKHNNDVMKHDADLLVNYSITRWVNLVFGLKYQGYIIENKIRTYFATIPGLEIRASGNIRFHSGGGGIGMSFIVPLGADFYLFPGFSGICLVGKDFVGLPSILNAVASSLFSGIDKRGYSTFVITGAMGSLSIAYYIKAARLTIEAGGRAQYLYYTQKPRSDIIQRYDLFFGPYLGVVYSFM